MGKMVKKKTVIMVILVSLLVIVPTSLYLLFFQMPIKTSPEALILTREDAPGWYGNMTNVYGLGYGWSDSPPQPVSETLNQYYNDSLAISMTIVIKSFGSSGDAHAFFSALGYSSDQQLNDPLEMVNEQVVFSRGSYVQNSTNWTEVFTGHFWTYDFRIENVLVILEFCEVFKNESIYHSPGSEWTNDELSHISSIHPLTQDWMKQVVTIQVEKIQGYNFHI